MFAIPLNLAAMPGALNATLPRADPLVPAEPSWVAGFLLLILWLTVAAILLGPLLQHFRLLPRSRQVFAGEKAK